MRRGLAGIAATAALLVAVSGCELKDSGDNLVAGKQNFVAKCGSCHVLKRAGTTGVTGPNLDEAFHQARQSGFGENTFEGVVYRQILQPAKSTQVDPKSGKPTAAMPAKIFTGEDAEDVAAYVAGAVARPGEDGGRLAQIGVKRSNEVAKPKDGKLEIPADASGGLAYTFGAAEAPAGPLEIDSPNKSSVDHNIALEGGGVDEKGPVVKGGAVSTIKVDVKPGDYTFYCSVPGHRQGGMEGKLTVK
ncbi:MAG TPA: c-type cytochrome [Solirubrobacteraceae bacterium]|nr:c-type cytochrome [Solirubrobacteraceae bacterium]